VQKRIFLCCLTLCVLLGFGMSYAAGDTPPHHQIEIEQEDIGIYLNGTYQTDEAARGVLAGSRTLVPLRFISESLGAQVDWEGETQTVTVSNDTVKNVITIGAYSAQKTENGRTETVVLDACPVLIGERTYVPVRYIAESLNKIVDWDGARNAALICDTQYLVHGGKAVCFTDGMASVRQAFGEPDETFDSCKGFVWQVYNSNTPELMLFGEKSGAITEFFSISDSMLFDSALLSAHSKEELAAQFPTPLTEVFYDDIAARFGGLYFSTQGSGNKTYGPTKSEEEIAAAESHVIELVTNALRAKYSGLAPLAADNAAASAARKHCTDMQRNDYFDHTSRDGSKPSERYMREEGAAAWQKLGENLALNKNAFSACFAWMNSAPHRDCMLDGDYAFLGVGADYTDRDRKGNYYGQIYIKK
jgi:uncharacterized protein YkwD